MSSTSNSDKIRPVECCGMTIVGLSGVGLLGVILYNFVTTIIAIINFTNEDVESVCPDSELWWWALFIGIIWPFLLSNGAKNASEKDKAEMPFLQVIVWIIMITSFIVWAWDQLWGVPGFANNTCAMNNWETYNNTEGANNDGHDLFIAVERWMFTYMVIDLLLILPLCGFGGYLVIGACFEKKQNVGNTDDSYNDV